MGMMATFETIKTKLVLSPNYTRGYGDGTTESHGKMILLNAMTLITPPTDDIFRAQTL